MKPVYIDLHIHTSEDPNSLNESYDTCTLLKKISESSKGEDFLISLTDHNTINKVAYLDLVNKLHDQDNKGSLILGAELHIRKYKEDVNSKAYHCHIFFDLKEITEESINDINKKLNKLYPNKTPERLSQDIPMIDDILDAFDQYEYLLLPHGGQTHSTFNETVRSTSEEKQFDNVLAKNLYYNFFDGFTSRSNSGVDKTFEYFKRLGIDQFIGLVTASDNYNPSNYPEPKSKESTEYVPTWMFASPTYDGLRIALSDTTRLICSKDKPNVWEKSIQSATLDNETIKIDIELTAGLNVIIGASSSGKTLLVDSINRNLNKLSFDSEVDKTSVYNEKYSVENIDVVCPSGIKPYYIHQNYISGIINTHNHINEIEPLDKLFPDTKEQRKKISKAFEDLKRLIGNLFNSVQVIESLEKEIYKIPSLASLITTGDLSENIFELLNEKAQSNIGKLEYLDYLEDKESLDRIHTLLKEHPLIDHNEKAYQILLSELVLVREYSIIDEKMGSVIAKYKDEQDVILEKKLGKDQKRQTDFKKLLVKMRKYGSALNQFNFIVSEITKFRKTYETPEKEINGHKLYFEGTIEINEKIILDSLNKYILNDKKIAELQRMSHRDLYSKNFSKNQPGNPTGACLDYSIISNNIFNLISQREQSHPKIITKSGEDFEDLSPGKKTAVILDLILSFKGDSAPIIIDQPEDNLSAEYMNTELIDLIKKVKEKKQVIFVSHNATIPMIGDAQNVILCKNENNKIVISSARLEGTIDDKKVVDHIVAITDGGKQSVKKRFKKYNLKKFN